MSIFDLLFHRDAPRPEEAAIVRGLNGQFLPTAAERRRRANEVGVRLELEMLKLHLPPEQFDAAILRASVRSVPIEKV